MANYHVDYINGSNATGDGSTGNPWGTASFALTESSAGAGDTIKVAGSGLTLADATATFSTNNSLTTSSDLQGVISVGDLVNVSPNGVADYVDWPTLYVTAITATTITFYENIYMPGDWRLGTSTYTIKTIGDTFVTTAASIETFEDGVGAGAIVEGGYDPTFTSIVGLTRFRRGGMGAGSTTGYGWDMNQANNTIDSPRFKNFAFAQFNRSWETNFGASFFGTNLHSYGANGRGFSYFGTIASVDGGVTLPKIYLSNSTGEFSQNYFSNFWNAGYETTIELYQMAHNRFLSQGSNIAFSKFVMWNVGAGSNNEDFGSTVNLISAEQVTFKNATYLTNIIEDASAPATNRAMSLWSSAIGSLDTITLIDGNTTEKYYYRHCVDGNKSVNYLWKNTVVLPTGYDLTSSAILERQPSCRDVATQVMRNGDNHMLEDTNGKWMVTPGCLQRTSTTVFDTGSSSRQILLGARDSYAAGDPEIMLTEIEKVSATPPTSVTIRYKGTGTSFGSRLYFSNKVAVDFTTNNQQMTMDDTWRDATFTCNSTSDTKFANYWDELTIGSYYGVKWTALFFGQLPREFYIDSVTVTY